MCSVHISKAYEVCVCVCVRELWMHIKCKHGVVLMRKVCSCLEDVCVCEVHGCAKCGQVGNVSTGVCKMCGCVQSVFVV